MIQRILWLFGALAFGGLTFLVGLYATFPSSAAKDRLVYEFGESSRHEYALDVGKLSLWRLSGVQLDDVSVYTVKKGRRLNKDDQKSAGERALMVHLDNLGVRIAPLATLMGKKAIAFSTQIYDGDVTGQYATKEDLVELAFDAGGVDLSQLPIATPEMKLVLKGVLSGNADLSFDGTDVKKSTGTLKLAFDGLGLGADSAMGGFTLPEVTFSKAGLSFEVKDGKLEVTEGDFESDTLNATVSGDIVLNKKLARSRNRLEIAFSLPDDLDKLAQIAPDLKRSRDEDGKYHLNIGGTIFSPTVRFNKTGSGHSLRDSGALRDGPSLRDGAGPLAAGGDFDPSASEEDRRKAREERIRLRRERLQKRREEAQGEGGGMPSDRAGLAGRDMPEGGDDQQDAGDDNGPRGGNDARNGNDDGPPGMMMPQPQFPPDGPMDGPQNDPGDEGNTPPDFDPNQQ